MDDLNEQIERLRYNRSRLERPDREIKDFYGSTNDDEGDGDEPIEGDSAVKQEGVGGVFTFQLILVLIIVIAYVLIVTFSAPLGNAIITLVNDKSQNDFVFKDKVYDSVGAFLTYINDSTGTSDGTIETQGTPLPDDETADPSSDVTSQEASVPVVDGETKSAGGEFTPVLNNEVPANATLSRVNFSGNMQFPLNGGYWISSKYGFRDHPSSGEAEFHTAVDIAANKQDDVYAVAGATVESCGISQSLGNYVWLDHGDGFKTLYGHCDSIEVKQGQTVKKGAVIAKVGSTGDSTGNHLHFGMKKDDIYFNPGYVFEKLA